MTRYNSRKSIEIILTYLVQPVMIHRAVTGLLLLLQEISAPVVCGGCLILSLIGELLGIVVVLLLVVDAVMMEIAVSR